jgi:hypothetical protein
VRYGSMFVRRRTVHCGLLMIALLYILHGEGLGLVQSCVECTDTLFCKIGIFDGFRIQARCVLA